MFLSFFCKWYAVACKAIFPRTWRVLTCVKIQNRRLQIQHYFLIGHVSFISIYFGYLIFMFTFEKTLPEAQRTQGIESITWVNLSTRIVWNWFQWNFLNWLQIWPPDGATCIGCQFCHRMHHLHIDSKFDHQMAPIALVANLPTRWRHLH